MKMNTKTLFAALAAVTLMTPACGGDAGKKGDEKKTEAKADAPKADAPKADAPKADAPKADAPKTDVGSPGTELEFAL